jgi:hypothetical protein
MPALDAMVRSDWPFESVPYALLGRMTGDL